MDNVDPVFNNVVDWDSFAIRIPEVCPGNRHFRFDIYGCLECTEDVPLLCFRVRWWVQWMDRTVSAFGVPWFIAKRVIITRLCNPNYVILVM
jgi:hypothetical protein